MARLDAEGAESPVVSSLERYLRHLSEVHPGGVDQDHLDQRAAEHRRREAVVVDALTHGQGVVLDEEVLARGENACEGRDACEERDGERHERAARDDPEECEPSELLRSGAGVGSPRLLSTLRRQGSLREPFQFSPSSSM